ncbi:MAG: cyclic lactone autoinducer peptide [Clostridia bacterium]|nr:cyclic lactone autoinducer peptide [Clostridia bacterium]
MFKHKILSMAACLVAFVAATGVGTRCMWIYEPEAPDCLKKEL